MIIKFLPLRSAAACPNTEIIRRAKTHNQRRRALLGWLVVLTRFVGNKWRADFGKIVMKIG